MFTTSKAPLSRYGWYGEVEAIHHLLWPNLLVTLCRIGKDVATFHGLSLMSICATSRVSVMLWMGALYLQHPRPLFSNMNADMLMWKQWQCAIHCDPHLLVTCYGKRKGARTTHGIAQVNNAHVIMHPGELLYCGWVFFSFCQIQAPSSKIWKWYGDVEAKVIHCRQHLLVAWFKKGKNTSTATFHGLFQVKKTHVIMRQSSSVLWMGVSVSCLKNPRPLFRDTNGMLEWK